jgi:hypothetical protein
VAVGVVTSLALYIEQVRTWDEHLSHYREIAAWLSEDVTGAVPLIADPPGFAYAGGGPSIVLPSNGPGAALEAADRYGARYLVLEQAHSSAYETLWETREHARLRFIGTAGTTHVYRISP